MQINFSFILGDFTIFDGFMFLLLILNKYTDASELNLVAIFCYFACLRDYFALTQILEFGFTVRKLFNNFDESVRKYFNKAQE